MSMWTIGRSQRVEEKKNRPIVRKIRYMISIDNEIQVKYQIDRSNFWSTWNAQIIKSS